jgi:hypothetical protein
VLAQVHEVEQKWIGAQEALVRNLKGSKEAFVGILKQEQATDYAGRSVEQAEKQVKKAEKTIASLHKKGSNTATAATKLRQAQSIRDMCTTESEGMAVRTDILKRAKVKRALVQNVRVACVRRVPPGDSGPTGRLVMPTSPA